MQNFTLLENMYDALEPSVYISGNSQTIGNSMGMDTSKKEVVGSTMIDMQSNKTRPPMQA